MAGYEPTLEGTQELAEAVSGSQGGSQSSSGARIEMAVVQSVDQEANTATVTLLNAPFTTFPGVEAHKSGVLPAVGRVVALIMIGDEPIMLSPLHGTMSVGGTLSSPTPDPKNDGWFIDSDGDVWFNSAHLRGNLLFLNPTELFANGGFESTLAPWADASSGGTTTRDNTRAFAGLWSMKVANSSPFGVAESEIVTGIKAGQAYRVSGWLWATVGGIIPPAITVDFEWKDADGDPIPTTNRTIVSTPPHSWIPFAVAAIAPAAAEQVQITLVVGGSGPNLACWFDALSLREFSLVEGAYLRSPIADSVQVDGPATFADRVRGPRIGFAIRRASNLTLSGMTTIPFTHIDAEGPADGSGINLTSMKLSLPQQTFVIPTGFAGLWRILLETQCSTSGDRRCDIVFSTRDFGPLIVRGPEADAADVVTPALDATLWLAEGDTFSVQAGTAGTLTNAWLSMDRIVTG